MGRYTVAMMGSLAAHFLTNGCAAVSCTNVPTLRVVAAGSEEANGIYTCQDTSSDAEGVTSPSACSASGGSGYNVCSSTGVHYCCGLCKGRALCSSNSGLEYCACVQELSYEQFGDSSWSLTYSHIEHWRLSNELADAYIIAGSRDLWNGGHGSFNGRYERIAAECNGKPVYQVSGNDYVLFQPTDRSDWMVSIGTSCAANGYISSAGNHGLCRDRPDGSGCAGKWQEYDGSEWQHAPALVVTGSAHYYSNDANSVAIPLTGWQSSDDAKAPSPRLATTYAFVARGADDDNFNGMYYVDGEDLRGDPQFRKEVVVQTQRSHITSPSACSASGGSGYNVCSSTGVHYCCGTAERAVCKGRSLCSSNSGLGDCACVQESSPNTVDRESTGGRWSFRHYHTGPWYFEAPSSSDRMLPPEEGWRDSSLGTGTPPVLVHGPFDMGSPQCDAAYTDKREDCGFPGISAAECISCDASSPDPGRCRNDGCCYRRILPLQGPSCYFLSAVTPQPTPEAPEHETIWMLVVVFGVPALLFCIFMICSPGCPYVHFSASSLPGPCAAVVYTASTMARVLGDSIQRCCCCANITPAARVAHKLLSTTWTKTADYEFIRITRVKTLRNRRLASRYHKYKWSLPDDAVNIPSVVSLSAASIDQQRRARHAGRTTVGSMKELFNHEEQRHRYCGHCFRCGSDVVGNEVFVFHGSADKNYASLARDGFLKKYWRTSSGSWQRFGSGFYFGFEASKSHEYPLAEMRKLSPGVHTRTMLMCKVARGRIHMTQSDIPDMTGHRLQALGFNSLHGYAGTRLNYDEFVVYEEEAILPYALVTYQFRKK